MCSSWKNEYCRELQSLLEKGKDPLTPANILAHEDPGHRLNKIPGKMFPELEVWALIETLHRHRGRFGTQNKCVFCVLSGHKDWAGGKREVLTVAL